jgi:hypothetical protein
MRGKRAAEEQSAPLRDPGLESSDAQHQMWRSSGTSGALRR